MLQYFVLEYVTQFVLLCHQLRQLTINTSLWDSQTTQVRDEVQNQTWECNFTPRKGLVNIFRVFQGTVLSTVPVINKKNTLSPGTKWLNQRTPLIRILHLHTMMAEHTGQKIMLTMVICQQSQMYEQELIRIEQQEVLTN